LEVPNNLLFLATPVKIHKHAKQTAFSLVKTTSNKAKFPEIGIKNASLVTQATIPNTAT